MTTQTRIKFGDMMLLVGMPGTNPMQFRAPCGINQFGREFVTNTNDVELRDCDDPDAPVWLGMDIISKRMSTNFQGVVDQQSHIHVWREWAMAEEAWPIRVYERVGDSAWGYWEGDGVLTNYSDTANGGGSYTNTGTVVFDGKPVWVGTPPAPKVTTSVSVSASIAPEEGVAFTATAGTYTGTPVLTYQWYDQNGVAISGATSIAYTPVSGDVGKRLRVVEVATNANGSMTTSSELSLVVIT